MKSIFFCGFVALALSFWTTGKISRAGEVSCDYVTSGVKTVYFGIEVPTPDPGHPIAVSEGHTDLEVPYIGCAWELGISNEEVPVEVGDALLFAGMELRFILPTIPPAFEFIGADAGETFWVMPQNSSSNVILLGISSEGMALDDSERLCEWNPDDPRGGANVPGKWIRVELVDVRGPVGGYFSVWQTTGPGQVVQFMSTFDGGITAADAFHGLAGSHTHMNWGFTKPGIYEVDFRLSTFVAPMKGDVACDCSVDFPDVEAFVTALLDAGAFAAAFPDCNLQNADVNGDGLVDGADVEGFVDVLVGG